MCNVKFDNEYDIDENDENAANSITKKVRDHDHLLLKNNFRGAACNGCNL